MTRSDQPPSNGMFSTSIASPSWAMLDRMAARALHDSVSGIRMPLSDEAKNRLYSRMFPDDVCIGPGLHDKS